MGRHSAPDTDEEGPELPTQRVPSVGWTEPVPSARPVPAEEPVGSEAASATTAPVVTGAAEPAQAARAPQPAPARATGTRGDLQLLRSDTGLLLWCAGAIVLIFLVYTSVLILLGRTDVYLIWLWVPTVLSGMTIGGLLDRAHRAVAQRDRPAP